MTLPIEPQAAHAHDPRGDRRCSPPAASIQKPISFSTGAGARARRARVDLRLRGAARNAQPHDPVQRESGQGPRERLDRAVQLSGADGGRHSPSTAQPTFRSATIRSSTFELARDIAQKFNNDFAASIGAHGHGDAFFPLPEPLIQGPATRVMSLRDGTKKMSKSDPVRILLHRPHRRSGRDRAEDPQGQDRSRAAAKRGRGSGAAPEADNLVGIFAGLNDETKADVLVRFGGSQFSAFKTALADLAIEKLSPNSRRNPAFVGRSGLYRRRPRDGRRKGARHRAAEYGRDQRHPWPRPIAGTRLGEARGAARRGGSVAANRRMLSRVDQRLRAVGFAPRRQLRARSSWLTTCR